jgi:hypothetical protein
MLAALSATLTTAALTGPLRGPGDHPTPRNDDLPGDLSTKLGTLMGWSLRIGYVACFFGFVYAAAKMAIAHRRGEEVNFAGLATTAAGCLVMGSAGAIADALIF